MAYNIDALLNAAMEALETLCPFLGLTDKAAKALVDGITALDKKI